MATISIELTCQEENEIHSMNELLFFVNEALKLANDMQKEGTLGHIGIEVDADYNISIASDGSTLNEHGIAVTGEQATGLKNIESKMQQVLNQIESLNTHK